MSKYARRKPRSLYKALTIPLLMILLGMIILSPATSFGASRNDDLVYLYPTKTNNPVEANGLFWLEAAPQIGSLTLDNWTKILPNKTLAIGAPESHVLGASMFGSAFHLIKKGINQPRRPGQIGEGWQKYVLEKKGQDKEPPKGGRGPRDILVFKRTIGPNGITEDIKVEVGEHFGDNDSFDRYVDKVRDKLVSNPEELKEALKQPPKKSFWDSNGAEITIGGGLVLSGLLSALKVMWPLIFAL